MTRSPAQPAPRRYRSERRREQAEQTRARIVEVAGELFGEKGWGSTAVRDVAASAGVAVETVYASVGSKADLLLAAVDVAVVGDAAPVPLAARPEFEVMGRGSLEDRLANGAALAHEVNARTHRLTRALREGARSDERLAARLVQREENRRADVARGLGLVAGRTPTDVEIDGASALLSDEVYVLLVAGAGWSGRRYERWLAGMLARVLEMGGEP